MSTLAQSILTSAQGLPEGGVVAPREFLHLASRVAVDQALTRLTREGKLMRVGRGTYVVPVSGRFGARPPASAKVVESMAKKAGEIVAPHGAAAANALGLTTQVPVKEVFVTSGRSRTLQFGSRVVEIRHVPGWQLALGSGPAGAAIRALSWLGPEHAKESVARIKSRLPVSEWEAIAAARAVLPSWMAKAVSESLLYA